MAFEAKEFVQKKSTSKMNETGCLVGLVRRSHAPAYLNISLREEVGASMGLVDLSMVRLYLGTGDDDGYVLLKLETDGQIRVRKKSLKFTNFFVIACGHVAEMPNFSALSKACICEVIEPGVIKIKLPDWVENKSVAKPNPQRTVKKTSGFDHLGAIRRAAQKVPAKLVGG